jgi:serine/threonine protein kinase
VFSSQKVKLDDFRLVQTVGKGGFGKVLKVQNLRGSGKGKIYAMKILRKQHVVDTRQVKTTKTERRILQQIDHPFVVKLRYAFQSSSKLYMIMDYYSGGSLFYHIERRGQFCENDVRFFAAEITLALEHLHCHGVIYRDLKLENILLDDLGHVALTDFGLSKDECNETNLANTFCGTPVYVAPEVIAKEAYGFSIDWWALGVVMYELLSGRVPFASRDRRRMFDKIVNSEVEFCNFFSKDAQSIIGELLAKDPDFRLGSFLNGNGGKDVQQHHFFVGYGYTDFEQVYRKDKIPPFRPSTYICESNVRGIEARDTLELVAEDICNFDNFTLVGSPR